MMDMNDRVNDNNRTDDNWICDCGKENFGNFCVACGKPKKLREYEKNTEHNVKLEGTNDDLKENTLRIDNNQQNPTVTTKDENNSMKNIIIVIALGVIVFASIGMFISNMTENEADKSQTIEEKAKNNKEDKYSVIEELATKASELSLNGLDLGTNVEKMHAVLGKENSSKANNGNQYFQYDDVRVIVKNNVVVGLVSESNNAYSKRGLHAGVKLKDVISIYGDNYLKSKYENLDLYEYKFTTINNENGLLRFAVNSADDKVQYISARIVDKVASSKGETIKAQHPAMQVLYDYHANITNKKYREAYDCLSGNLKKKMSYDGWVPGFKTTVSSVPSDVKIYSQNKNKVVLTFYLRAVDNPGGTRDFSGTAEVINTRNGWKLDKMYHNLK